MCNISISHCRGLYLREFAHKTVSGIDIPNKDGYLPDLRRLNYNPIINDEIMLRCIKRYANRPGEYVTVYSYENTTEKGTIDYKTAKINRIYLDFDNADNPQIALNEAILTIKSLIKRNIFPHCYFSGNKGIALYIEFITVDIKPEYKKDVLCLFFDMVKDAVLKDYNKKCETLDHQVRGDIARVSRIPNSIHKSGFYCIPLNFGDMYRGIDHIKNLAKTPRTFDLDRVIAYTMMRNEKMPVIIKNLEKQVIVNRETEKKKKELETRKYQAIKNRHPDRKGSITDEMIKRAKSVSISSVISHDKKIVCPLHNDHEASLSIDHDKGLWHCFGCSKGGDVIAWIMEKEHLDFKNAVMTLAGV